MGNCPGAKAWGQSIVLGGISWAFVWGIVVQG